MSAPRYNYREIVTAEFKELPTLDTLFTEENISRNQKAVTEGRARGYDPFHPAIAYDMYGKPVKNTFDHWDQHRYPNCFMLASTIRQGQPCFFKEGYQSLAYFYLGEFFIGTRAMKGSSTNPTINRPLALSCFVEALSMQNALPAQWYMVERLQHYPRYLPTLSAGFYHRITTDCVLQTFECKETEELSNYIKLHGLFYPKMLARLVNPEMMRTSGWGYNEDIDYYFEQIKREIQKCKRPDDKPRKTEIQAELFNFIKTLPTKTQEQLFNHEKVKQVFARGTGILGSRFGKTMTGDIQKHLAECKKESKDEVKPTPTSAATTSSAVSSSTASSSNSSSSSSSKSKVSVPIANSLFSANESTPLMTELVTLGK